MFLRPGVEMEVVLRDLLLMTEIVMWVLTYLLCLWTGFVIAAHWRVSEWARKHVPRSSDPDLLAV